MKTFKSIIEDVYTSEYKLKKWVDPVTGKTKERKVHPHRVEFDASKMRGEPSKKDAKGDYGMKEETMNEQATVKTQKYSWGTMKTVHHGSSFSVPLHPEHHQAIHALKDQQEHKFKDETGRHWTAKRDGENVHLHSANDGPKTTIKHSDLKEEVETIDEKMTDAQKEAVRSLNHAKGTPPTTSGTKKAIKFVKQNEEVESVEEQLLEVLSKDAKAGDWISDFVKSDNPKFEGKSKKERIKMALGAYYGKQNEETSLDESMTDSWKQVQSMDKGSVTGGKEEVKKHLTYLNAVHAHHKKFGNDTKKVKDQIERINRSGIAEEVEALDEKSEQARKNKTMKNVMDASKGAAYNRTTGLNLKPGDTGHQTAQQMNKALGRHLRREELELEEGNGYDDNRTGFAKKPREDDEYHNEPKPAFKAKSVMDRPHDVHIDGKKWKTFSNGHQAKAAVSTLQAKGKKATATAQFKEETMDTLTRIRSLISAKINEAKYAGLEKEDKKGLPTALVKKSEKAVAGDTVEGWDHPHDAVKEGKTFKEFAMMLEYESDESGRYVHKGKKNYGNDNDEFDQHDDFEKKPKAPTAAAKAGRPTGSKSGARKITGTSKLYK